MMGTKAFAHNSSHQTFLANAQIALKFALQQLNIHVGDKILLPDFICDVVAEVIMQSGGVPVYYPLEDNLSPNWPALELAVKNSKCCVLFMVHYFGQPQDIKRFQLFCTQNNLLLLEDNAHGYGGFFLGEPLGLFGDVGISSPRKLLGTLSGGILHGASEHSLEVIKKLKPQPLFRLVTPLKMVLQRMPRARIFIRQLISRVDQLKLFPSNLVLRVTDNYRIDIYSRWRITTADWRLVGIRRRSAWVNWERFFSSRGLQVVFPTMYAESCPWALPFYAGNLAERDFWLEWGLRNGVLIFSWPTLPSDVKIKNGNAVERWERMLCIDLSQDIPQRFNL